MTPLPCRSVPVVVTMWCQRQDPVWGDGHARRTGVPPQVGTAVTGHPVRTSTCGFLEEGELDVFSP